MSKHPKIRTVWGGVMVIIGAFEVCLGISFYTLGWLFGDTILGSTIAFLPGAVICFMFCSIAFQLRKTEIKEGNL